MTEKEEKTYSISELAKEFDITTRSIRFYEDQRLLTPLRTRSASRCPDFGRPLHRPG